MVDLLHRSAGGVSLLSLRSLSISRWLVRTTWTSLPAVLRRMTESQINMIPECLVCWCIFRKPGNVTEDRIPTAFCEIRYQIETGARCDLGVPGVILPTYLGYMGLALNAESFQASFISCEYCPSNVKHLPKLLPSRDKRYFRHSVVVVRFVMTRPSHGLGLFMAYGSYDLHFCASMAYEFLMVACGLAHSMAAYVGGFGAY